MRYFVTDIKDGKFNIDYSLARVIYQNLNKNEQAEIENWRDKNPKLGLNDVISILYGTLSQRRRMNPRLVKAIREYKEKDSDNINLVIVEINDNINYIQIDYDETGGEYLLAFKDKGNNECEGIELWLNQKTIFEETQENTKEKFSVNEFLEDKNKSNSINIKKLFNQSRRWLYSLTHKEVRKFNKNRKHKGER